MATYKKALAAETPEKVSTDNDVKIQEAPAVPEQPAEKKSAEKKTASKKTAAKKSEEKPTVKKTDESTEKIEKKEKSVKKTVNKTLCYEDVVEKTKKKVLAADITKITDSISVQIEINGECSGIFYIEIRNGSIVVMPYDYKNADIEIIVDSTEFVKIIEGKLNVYEAISNGILRIFGNAGKAVLFVNAVL